MIFKLLRKAHSVQDPSKTLKLSSLLRLLYADPTTHAATPDPQEKTTSSSWLTWLLKKIFLSSSLSLKHPVVWSITSVNGILKLFLILPLCISTLGSGSIPLNRPLGLASINLNFLCSRFFFISSNFFIFDLSNRAC